RTGCRTGSPDRLTTTQDHPLATPYTTSADVT
ncbi:hypothetical protein ABH935_009637, partial [Catenulispora sp. GAS73]